MVCKYAVIVLYNNLFWNETTMLLHKGSKDKPQIERTQREKISKIFLSFIVKKYRQALEKGNYRGQIKIRRSKTDRKFEKLNRGGNN